MSITVVRRPVGSTRRIGTVLLILFALTASIGAAAAAPPDAVDRPGSTGRAVDVGTAPDGHCRHPWTAPVDAPVVDPFRPPAGPYGPGNRGIEYGTEPGQAVVAIGAGVIGFAGPVAGRPVVVVDHGAGLRSSYVNLTERSVGRGQQVARGQRIATSDNNFHLGVRRDGRYVDPAPMFDQLCEVIRLVPLPRG
jgi:murein DD-endopeptidase MepM/ murein hydrolase activator NlpD